jgi:hypothetical protein
VITTEPVGDWTWEVPLSGDLPVSGLAMETSASVWDVLEKYELASSAGRAEVSAASTTTPRDVWFHKYFTVTNSETLRSGSPIFDLPSRVNSEVDYILTTQIQCPGIWLESGRRNRAEKLFTIQVDIWKSALLVMTLQTYSDAWLTFDTRDRAQSDVFRDNAPRLAATLAEISERFKTPVSPGDPNHFATPTANGFEDPGTEGASYVDSWGTFESAARSRKLRVDLPPGPLAYEEVTACPVRYITISRNGRKVGFVWASVGDFAAGYAPRTAAGEDAFTIGKKWLLLLREAHSKNFTPLEALGWLAQSAPPDGAGEVEEGGLLEASSLEELEELSGTY